MCLLVDPAPNRAVPGIEPLGSAALALEQAHPKPNRNSISEGLLGPV